MLRQSDSQACRTDLGLHRWKVRGMWGEMSVHCIAPDRTVGGEQQLVSGRTALVLAQQLRKLSMPACFSLQCAVCAFQLTCMHNGTAAHAHVSTLNSRWVALHAWCALTRSAPAALQAGMQTLLACLSHTV